MKESHMVLEEVNMKSDTVSGKKFLVNKSISWQRKPFPLYLSPRNFHSTSSCVYHIPVCESVNSLFISSGRSAAEYRQCQKPVPLVFSVFNKSHSTSEFQKPLEHLSAAFHVLSRGKF
jgi:hypothetical protein